MTIGALLYFSAIYVDVPYNVTINRKLTNISYPTSTGFIKIDEQPTNIEGNSDVRKIITVMCHIGLCNQFLLTPLKRHLRHICPLINLFCFIYFMFAHVFLTLYCKRLGPLGNGAS